MELVLLNFPQYHLNKHNMSARLSIISPFGVKSKVSDPEAIRLFKEKNTHACTLRLIAFDKPIELEM